MSDPQSTKHEPHIFVEPAESMTQDIKSAHADELENKKDDEIAIHDENEEESNNEEEGSKND